MIELHAVVWSNWKEPGPSQWSGTWSVGLESLGHRREGKSTENSCTFQKNSKQMHWLWYTNCMAVDGCPSCSVPMCGKGVCWAGIWAASTCATEYWDGRTRIECAEEGLWTHHYGSTSDNYLQSQVNIQCIVPSEIGLQHVCFKSHRNDSLVHGDSHQVRSKPWVGELLTYLGASVRHGEQRQQSEAQEIRKDTDFKKESGNEFFGSFWVLVICHSNAPTGL